MGQMVRIGTKYFGDRDCIESVRCYDSSTDRNDKYVLQACLRGSSRHLHEEYFESKELRDQAFELTVQRLASSQR